MEVAVAILWTIALKQSLGRQCSQGELLASEATGDGRGVDRVSVLISSIRLQTLNCTWKRASSAWDSSTGLLLGQWAQMTIRCPLAEMLPKGRMRPQATCPHVSLPFARPGLAAGPEAQAGTLGQESPSTGLAANMQRGVLITLGHLPVSSGLGEQPAGGWLSAPAGRQGSVRSVLPLLHVPL